MIVRRLLAGVLLTGIAVPALAAAPHASRQKAEPLPVVVGMGTRVFARADGAVLAQASPSASPSAAASPAPSGSPAPAGSGAPAASPTPASLGAARAEYEAWMNGKIDRSHYTAQANAVLTDSTVAQVSAQLKQVGAVQDITQIQRSELQPDVTGYVYRVRTATIPVEMLLAVDASGKYSGIRFRPAQP